ncbi:murein biosynthesis integral membrane protein MurJ [Epibacterium ulvae]|uniref:murein biosynthesis integral membrane protein MurJ n=1 Tax=Epibacterium ulvae TaxID=1156985 RepID=UPI001BFC9E15|nr:murein biosynthesis integral membrane protein MurJ [Epibacterium ulvae]MBT8155033.1 murein biosynthesis integral membrane protein MurJ [Epibacterium ulvae]
MKPIKLLSGFLTVGFWTLASRILGFAREILIAAYIGPGPMMDAFVAAFRLPNMFRRFFAEGAFNAAFVPMLSKKVEGEQDAPAFAQDAFNLLGAAVLLLVAVSMIFMPGMVWFTSGISDGDARFDATVGFGRIMFPYILCMSLAALFSGILNATGRFSAAAAASALLNVVAIPAMIAGAVVGGEVIQWLIWAIPVAGVAQLVLVWVAAEQAGFKLRPGLPRLTQDMRHMVKVALPAALAMGVTQVNLVVGQRVAQDIENALSWLFIADRLYQLPLGVVGIAVGIVLLPDLSRRLRAGDADGAQNALSRAGEFSLVLTLPSMVAFVVIPLPLISVLYERGATDAADVQAIALAVAIYGVGLPAFVLQKVLQPLYFAREDTRSPFRFALVGMAVNAALAVGLKPIVGWIAPAIAASAAGWAMVFLLWFGARRMGEVAQFDSRFYDRCWRIFAASGVMGAAVFSSYRTFDWLFYVPSWRYLALLGLIVLGAVTYFGAAQVLGAIKLGEMKQSLRRRGG